MTCKELYEKICKLGVEDCEIDLCYQYWDRYNDETVLEVENIYGIDIYTNKKGKKFVKLCAMNEEDFYQYQSFLSPFEFDEYVKI